MLIRGAYIIENAHNRNWAVLVNDNDGDDVISGTDADENAGEKWDIRRLHNGTFLLSNQRFQNHATYRVTDNIGDFSPVLSIRTGTPRHWRIKYIDGLYLISDLDGTRCWTLGNDHPHTPITLEEYSHNRRQHWKIVSVSESSGMPEDHDDQASRSSSQPQSDLRECLAPSPVFTGRHDVLDKMSKYFSTDLGERHIFVLHGLGGIGKSQIVFKFIQKCQVGTFPPRFTDVFFVDATSSETIETDLRNIALAKGAGNSASDALRWLRSHNEEWLLFIDNADDPSLNLSNYFPQCSHGNIIITSRNAETRVHAPNPRSSEKVTDMSPADARDLLLKVSGVGEDPSEETRKSATTIAEKLGHLALAIVQAGVYICKTGCSLAQYLEINGERQALFLEEYRKHVLKIDDYAWTVYTTWTVSFERLSSQASTFLNICAFLHHDGITATIFQNASHSVTTRVFYDSQGSRGLEMAKTFLDSFRNKDGTWELRKFLTIMTEIRSCSLIDLDEKNDMYFIHPLVHAWTRSRVSDVAMIHECSQYILGLSIIWRFEAEDMRYRRTLLPHVDASLRGRAIPDMAVQLALVYYESGRLKESEKLEVQDLEMKKRVLGDEHFDTLVSMGNLALTYRHRGRLKESEELLVKVTEMNKRILGEEHPGTLTSMGNLATTYSKQHRWKEAEELRVKVMKVRGRTLGEEHPDTLKSMDRLASTYADQGHLKKAEELYVKVMKMRKRILGDEHPNTLMSMRELEIIYSKQGRWKDAEELGEKVTEMRRRILGDEHPDTLKSIASLASTYRSQGRRKEAEAMEVMVMGTSKRVLGEDHPDTLKYTQVVADGRKTTNLGRMWLKKGKIFG